MQKTNLTNATNTDEILRGKPAQNDGSGDRAQTHETLRGKPAQNDGSGDRAHTREILRAEAAQNDGKNESGRSMTEMLGVLAVIGVLSVGTVAGISVAMDKARANETIAELNERGVVHLSNLSLYGELRQNEFSPRTQLGYVTQASLFMGKKDFFQQTLENVPQGLCKQLLTAEWQWPVYRVANGIEYRGDTNICRADMGVPMIFVFPTDVDGENGEFRKSCKTNDDCYSACGICQDGFCETQCPFGSACTAAYDNPAIYQCCTYESVVNGMCCSSVAEGACCSSQAKCCPMEAPLLDKDGNCHSCNISEPVNVQGNTVACGVCNGENGREKLVLNGSYCTRPCPPEKPLMDSKGGCHRCDEYARIYVVNKQACTSVCNGEDDDIHMERQYFSGYGICDYPCEENEVTTSGGADICMPCNSDATKQISITFRSKTECETKCDGSSPERPKRYQFNLQNGESMCLLETCPPEAPIKSDRRCHTCAEKNIYVKGGNYDFSETCFNCPNRALKGNVCIKSSDCPSGTKYDAASKKCVCTGTNQFQDSNGICHDCGTDSVVEVAGFEENCNACNGARVVKKFGNGYVECMKKCAADEYYTMKGCKACDNPEIVKDEVWGGCAHCTYCDGKDGRAERVCLVGGHWCGMVCSEDKTMAADASCHSCDETEPFDINNGMSASCTNFCAGQRYVVGNMCYKCPSGTYSIDTKTCVVCPIAKETLSRKGDCVACGGVWDGNSCEEK